MFADTSSGSTPSIADLTEAAETSLLFAFDEELASDADEDDDDEEPMLLVAEPGCVLLSMNRGEEEDEADRDEDVLPTLSN